MSTNPCVFAECYRWLAADTIAVVTDTEDTDFPLTNVKDIRIFSRQQSRIHTSNTGTNGAGWQFTLNSSISLYCISTVAMAWKDEEDCQFRVSTVSPYSGASLSIDTSNVVCYPSDVYTNSGAITSNSPVNTDWICGYDTFATTGPTVQSTPTLTSVTCHSGIFSAKSPQAGNNGWRFGYLALGINGRELPAVSQLSSRPIPLNVGEGRRWTLSWTRIPIADALYLDALIERNRDHPVFCFPAPGGKASDGQLSAVTDSQKNRGGVVRLLSVDYGEVPDLAAGFVAATNVRVVCESWQELPVKS